MEQLVMITTEANGSGVEVQMVGEMTKQQGAMICFSGAIAALIEDGQTEREAMQFFHSVLTKTLMIKPTQP